MRFLWEKERKKAGTQKTNHKDEDFKLNSKIPFIFFVAQGGSARKCASSTTMLQGGGGGYSLSVADHDDEDGGHAAEDDDDSQGQQSPLGVAHGLRLLLHVGHHVGRADLQDPPTLAQVGLELLVDVQQFAVQEP